MTDSDERDGTGTIHERDGWAWINRCPRPDCKAETHRDIDGALEGIDGWVCDNGHWADMPNQQIVRRPKV